MSLLYNWFRTSNGLGYGVTDSSPDAARTLLDDLGFPGAGERIEEVVEDIQVSGQGQEHVVPNIGPLQFQGACFPTMCASGSSR